MINLIKSDVSYNQNFLLTIKKIICIIIIYIILYHALSVFIYYKLLFRVYYILLTWTSLIIYNNLKEIIHLVLKFNNNTS